MLLVRLAAGEKLVRYVEYFCARLAEKCKKIKDWGRDVDLNLRTKYSNIINNNFGKNIVAIIIFYRYVMAMEWILSSKKQVLRE